MEGLILQLKMTKQKIIENMTMTEESYHACEIIDRLLIELGVSFKEIARGYEA